MLNFQTLRAPPEDGKTLVEPAGKHWPALIEANQRLLRQQRILLAGIGVEEVRDRTRRQLLGREADGAIIACGHQPGFAHPGVWAKHVVVREACRRHGGACFNLVVDNDAPASAALTVPLIQGDGMIRTRQIDFWPGPVGSAWEGRSPLQADQLDKITAELQRCLGERYAGSALPGYLGGIAAAERPRDGVDQHLAGRRRLDESLGADLRELRVSEAFGGPLLAELLLSARRFAGVYNQALADYRRREGVRSPDRPLPDLRQHGERTETALWIYKPLERRRRLWVEPAGAALRLFADDSEVAAISGEELSRDAAGALAGLRPWLIRPRALTLTLWARLLACDLFVHGIGGAKYDRITDEIFRGYFRTEPPAVAVVTATLRLPLPRYEATPEGLQAARRRLRDVHYNPQRYLAAPPELLAVRDELIRRAGELRAARAPRPPRRQVFLGIRRANSDLLATSPQTEGELQREADRLVRELESDRLAASREYFYALQPVPRLEMLAQRLRSRMG